MKASELSSNSVVDIDGIPHVVDRLQVQTPSARGGATLYKVRFRNVKTKNKIDKSYRGDDKLNELVFEQREVQYLYKSGDIYVFMDLEDYSQIELMEEEIESSKEYLIEDMEGITALICDGSVLGIKMPDVVEMTIAECAPSMKGASATARTKPAEFDTGLTVQVPEYIAPGDKIRIDTRNNSFLSRA